MTPGTSPPQALRRDRENSECPHCFIPEMTRGQRGGGGEGIGLPCGEMGRRKPREIQNERVAFLSQFSRPVVFSPSENLPVQR
jgi:hypothetical protein